MATMLKPWVLLLCLAVTGCFASPAGSAPVIVAAEGDAHRFRRAADLDSSSKSTSDNVPDAKKAIDAKIAELKKQKQAAIEQEDYDRAKALKAEIEELEKINASAGEQFAWGYRNSAVMKEARRIVARNASILFAIFLIVWISVTCIDFGRFGIEVQQAVTIPRAVMFSLCCAITILGATYLHSGEYHFSKKLFHIADKADCMYECQTMQYAECRTVSFNTTTKAATVRNFWNSWDPPSSHQVKVHTCRFEVFPAPWIPYFVIGVSMMSIVMIVEGSPADVIFVCASIIFGLVGILDADTVYAGLSGGAVVSIAMLMVAGSAITETGWLDVVIAQVLGTSTIMIVGLSRMLVASALMSMFLPNAAMFLLVSPVVLAWSRRLGFSKKKLMAPIGVALQVGGQCTILGSAAPMVAKSLFDKEVYDLQMFDLTPVGGATAAVMLVAALIFLPLLPSDPSNDEGGNTVLPDLAFGAATTMASFNVEEESNTDNIISVQSTSHAVYIVKVVVEQGGTFDGANAQETFIQLSRFPGVSEVLASSTEMKSFVSAEDVADRPKPSAVLEAGQILVCHCTASGVVNLRKCRGIQLAIIKELLQLGTNRRRRHLYEAVVSPTSSLTDKPLDRVAFMSEYSSVIVGIRGKAIDGDVKYDATGAAGQRQVELDVGDTVLLEADDVKVKIGEPWSSNFSVLKMVPDSSPPRQGMSEQDSIRSGFVFLAFLGMIIAISLDAIGTSLGAGGLVVLFIVCKVISVDQLFEAIKIRALLVIVGSMGVASAMAKAGVAHFLSNKIAEVTLPIGPTLMRSLIYCICAGLSQLVSKTCTVALIAPMMPELAYAATSALGVEVSVQSMVWLVIFAAGACYITPFGEPASIFVMQDGEYTYGQFAKYGIALQIVHGIVTVALMTLV